MLEPTGEVPAQEPVKSEMITIPEGLLSPEAQARIDAALAPKEPIVNEEAQKIAQARIVESQQALSQASAEAVEAARTTNESLGIE